jgi:hypothetical protein
MAVKLSVSHLREEKLMVTEGRLLGRIIGYEEVTKGWSKCHNERYHNVLFTYYYYSDKIEEHEIGRA